MMNRITYSIATLETPSHSNERELYCSVMEKLNDFLKYIEYREHDKLNLSQAEISDLYNTLSVLSMSLANCD